MMSSSAPDVMLGRSSPQGHVPITRAISIAYHDVVEDLSLARPVAPGHTTLYTLSRRMFRDHLHAICARVGEQAVMSIDALHSITPVMPLLLTLDDGTHGAYACAAAELEAMGWRGHFFITTDWIGGAHCVSREQIRELHERGHVVGSHSCSHPRRMSALPAVEMVREWTESCAVLSDIIGQTVKIGSVPDGYYTRQVAQAAAASGLEVLFTSEPTAAAHSVDGCLVLGRYAVRRSTAAALVGSIAAGSRAARWQQAATWSAKKIAKRIAGPWYVSVRGALLARTARTAK